MNKEFTDTKFLSGNEKKQILRDFNSFIKALLENRESAFSKFTNRLYKHLHLHLNFCAHMDRLTFFETCFNGKVYDFNMFNSTFQRINFNSDYTDINAALNEVLTNNYKDLLTVFRKETLLRDLDTIKCLMLNHNIKQVVMTETGNIEISRTNEN